MSSVRLNLSAKIWQNVLLPAGSFWQILSAPVDIGEDNRPRSLSRSQSQRRVQTVLANRQGSQSRKSAGGHYEGDKLSKEIKYVPSNMIFNTR